MNFYNFIMVIGFITMYDQVLFIPEGLTIEGYITWFVVNLTQILSILIFGTSGLTCIYVGIVYEEEDIPSEQIYTFFRNLVSI